MKLDDPPNEAATVGDIRQAIESLSTEDNYRLRKAAKICLPGTEYQELDEILNEVITRTISAAIGQEGRRWPKSVPFIAYLIQTMKGLSDDSRNSSVQSKTDHLEAMGAEGASAEDVLDQLQHRHPDALSLVVEAEEDQERQNRARVDADKIDAYFTGDSEVTWIIMGHKDGQSAADIRTLADLTQTQYETARRRFRRGLEKLFPGRSKL